jgi:hypothetical protein
MNHPPSIDMLLSRGNLIGLYVIKYKNIVGMQKAAFSQ